MFESWQDVEAIKVLKAQYFRYMDTKAWDSWRKLFIEDLKVIVDTGVMTIGEAPISHSVEGADAFVASTRAKIHECITVHHGHMPEIQLTSTSRASGIWAMEDILQWPDQSSFRGFGHYSETYHKGPDGAWRIATLHLTRLKMER